MPRVPISKDTRQRVLDAAGNRCAVCGHSPPLVLSHITALSGGGDSSEPNLIALCPNCQARADMEAWAGDTLRKYKEKPWCERKAEAVESPERGTVTLTLSMDVGELDSEAMERIQKALAQFLETSASEIEVLRVEEG